MQTGFQPKDSVIIICFCFCFHFSTLDFAPRYVCVSAVQLFIRALFLIDEKSWRNNRLGLPACQESSHWSVRYGSWQHPVQTHICHRSKTSLHSRTVSCFLGLCSETVSLSTWFILGLFSPAAGPHCFLLPVLEEGIWSFPEQWRQRHSISQSKQQECRISLCHWSKSLFGSLSNSQKGRFVTSCCLTNAV